MSLGRILSKLLERRIKQYKIKYDPRFDGVFDSLLPIDHIEPISIKSILLLTDHRPRSIVSIAYALRLAKVLKADLLALIMGVHREMIEQETKEYKVNLALLEVIQGKPSINHVMKIIDENKVGLVIMHSLYDSSAEIVAKSPVPVLIIKINPFLHATNR